MDLSKDTLLSVGRFLAKTWSGERDVTLKFGENWETSFKKDKKHSPTIQVGDYDKPKDLSDFDKYRCWRALLFHESQRVHTPKKLPKKDFNPIDRQLFYVLENLRIDQIGIENYPGMKKEIMFMRAVALALRKNLDEINISWLRKFEAFLQKLYIGKLRKPNALPDEEIKKINEADKIAKDGLEKFHNTPTKLMGTAKKIREVLFPDRLGTFGWGPWTSEKELPSGDETRDAESEESEETAEEGEGPPDVKGQADLESFETSEEVERSKGKGGTDTSGYVETYGDEEAVEQINDKGLSNKLIAALRKQKTEWKESWERKGDEFDLQRFIGDGFDVKHSKPFLRDEQLKVEEDVAILIDLSGSIIPYQREYKRIVNSLCFAMKKSRINFSVYALCKNQSLTVKRKKESWGRTHLQKLAGRDLIAGGSTPLSDAYSDIREKVLRDNIKILITLTDGVPNDAVRVGEDEYAMDAATDTKEEIQEYQKRGTKMVAFGIGSSINDATDLSKNLKELGYDRQFATSNMQRLPMKILELLRAVA